MILGNDYVDLAPLFSAHSTRNYLLSTLDFTDPVGVSSHKVAVSQLVESNESLFNKETSRFSSEHNVTKREQGKEWLIEIPYFLREGLIVPADVQGKRSLALIFRKHSLISMRNISLNTMLHSSVLKRACWLLPCLVVALIPRKLMMFLSSGASCLTYQL